MLEKELDKTNVITCHLGNGCSITAVRNGRSVDTTMGFTALEGLVMETRSGDVDPGIIFHLLRKGHTAGRVETMLNKESGLLGISGISNDLRDLEEQQTSERAELAISIFAYRIRKAIGSYLCVLNGCDAIVFTGGIGENSVSMRERCTRDMESLGIVSDPEKNRALVGRREGNFAADTSRVSLLVIPTDEEAAIAYDTFTLAT